MSQFSQLLTDHIHSKNVKVYALAQYCELDRANMYKFTSGKRTPSSLELVEKICNFIQLSPDEKDELVEAWHIAQLGADTYYRRKHVSYFLKNFGLSHNNLTQLQTYQIPAKPEKHAVILNNEIEINHALTGILSSELGKENGHIQLLIQPDYDFLINILSIGWKNPSVHIEQIICLNNTNIPSGKKTDYNLHCLQKILPLYGNAYQYDCFYYYDNVNSRFGALTLFPYMIVTSEFVCLLSSNMKNGYLINSVESREMFADLFQTYQKTTQPLMKPVENMFFQFQALQEMAQKKIPVHAVHLSPCLTPFLTHKLLERYITEMLPERDIFIQTLENYVEQLYHNEHLKWDSIFSINGLRYFMDTGLLEEYPRQIYTPVSLSDRIHLLKQLILSFEQYHYRILKEDICSMENEFHLVISKQNGFLCFTTPQDHRMIYLDIKEPGFIFTFLDYYESLNESLFYSTSEALDLLKDVLKEYS